MKTKIVFAMLLFIIISVNVCNAAILHVPDDYSTIQAAINAADSGDIVLLESGTYSGSGNTNLSFTGKSLTIRSKHGPAFTTIDCKNNARAFDLYKLDPSEGRLEGISIINGYDDYSGGALSLIESSLIITNCRFHNCMTEEYGGAIYARRCDPIIENSRFTECIADQGGAIFVKSSDFTIRNCVLKLNAADEGGGLYIDSECQGFAIDTSFQSNLTTVAGGGIMVKNASPALVNVLIFDNVARMGGGIYSLSAYPEISTAWISGNQANHIGGGICCDDNSEIILTNSLIVLNQAKNGGGLTSASGSDLNIKNCTVTNNASDIQGGGIYCTLADLTVENSIVWYNGGGNLIQGEGGSIECRYSDIQGGFAGEGNIDKEPRFVTGLRGTFYLSQKSAGQNVNSPCVDAGRNQASDTTFIGRIGIEKISDYSTASNETNDSGVADMGYHYMVSLPAFRTQPNMPEAYFHPGDTCKLDLMIKNYSKHFNSALIFVALNIGTEFWFWDGWSQDIDFVDDSLSWGEWERSILPPFTWPDTGDSSLDGIVFYSAVIDPITSALLGSDPGLGMTSFGFGP